MNTRNVARLWWPLAICVVATLIFLIRLHGGTDLESYGQPTTIGHLLDLATQGHFFVQRDLNGIVMTSPPLHTWMVAFFTALFGLNRAALALPSFLSVLTIALLLFIAGRQRFGEPVGGLSAMAFLLSPATAKQIALAGAAPVFALAVTTAALAAAAASARTDNEKTDRRWRLFWLAGALATLTAGALGLLMAAGGLLSSLWDKASKQQHSTASPPDFAGLALFAALVLLWLLPAGFNSELGSVLRMLLPTTANGQIGELLKPATALFANFLPFSLFAFVALWRIIRQPAADSGERRFERFLVSWLGFGLLAVSLSASNGADPVFALWPAGALLAGREMARLSERMGQTKFTGVAIVIGCLLVGATYNAVHSVGPAKLSYSVLAKELQRAADAERAAKALKASDINVHTLTHLNTPTTLQFHLGTYRPLIDRAKLDELLATTSSPLDLATDSAGIDGLGGLERFANAQRIFRWPEDESLAPAVQVYRIAR